MKVLVCCEESQRVCSAFRDKGHEAYSCDIIDPSGGHPEWHIKGDVLPKLKPTEIVKEHVPFVNGGSKKADGSARSKQGLAYQTAGERSKTFEGIAKAMADQWGSAQ